MFDPAQYESLEAAMGSGGAYGCNINHVDLTDRNAVENVLKIVESTADMLSHKHRVEAFICQDNKIINTREVIYGIA
jgi:hypothetical protein